VNDYLVSAIVSTYANERFIEGCLRDLLRQTLGRQLEIIVIDSCSPQNEGVIVRRFQAKHPNIVLVRTEQRETLYQAWNRGIKMARGKYVTNANTDDRLRPDAYEIIARELDADTNIALVYGDILFTNLENQTFEKHIRTGFSRRPDYSPEIMLTGCHMGPQPMWRKEIHAAIGYFDESFRSAGDYEFWCRIALRYPMRHLRRFLGLYLHNPAGIANSNLSLSAQETQRVKALYSGRLPTGPALTPEEHFYPKPVLPGCYVNIGMATYNRLEYTRQALEGVVGHTHFPYVLTVVDNHSTDGTPEFLKDMQAEGLIHNLVLMEENLGVAKASNIAWLLESNAGFYLKLDNDIVLQKHGWLNDMIWVIDKIPRIGTLGYNFEPQSYPVETIRRRTIRIKKNGTLGGACILIPRRTRERLGFWSEEYGLYGEEDCDYGWRVLASGKWNAYMEDEDVGIHLPAGKASAIDAKTLTARDGLEENTHKQYREWKDNQRKANVTTGFLDENIQRYRKRTKSLFVEPTAALAYLERTFPHLHPQWRKTGFFHKIWRMITGGWQ
jgi:glycosyltransferase involved in cell wall biosynthesis